MGSIDIIKPLSTVLSSAANKSQQCRESNPGSLGAKRERYPFVLCGPSKLAYYLQKRTNTWLAYTQQLRCSKKAAEPGHQLLIY